MPIVSQEDQTKAAEASRKENPEPKAPETKSKDTILHEAQDLKAREDANKPGVPHHTTMVAERDLEKRDPPVQRLVNTPEGSYPSEFKSEDKPPLVPMVEGEPTVSQKLKEAEETKKKVDAEAKKKADAEAKPSTPPATTKP